MVIAPVDTADTLGDKVVAFFGSEDLTKLCQIAEHCDQGVRVVLFTTKALDEPLDFRPQTTEFLVEVRHHDVFQDDIVLHLSR